MAFWPRHENHHLNTRLGCNLAKKRLTGSLGNLAKSSARRLEFASLRSRWLYTKLEYKFKFFLAVFLDDFFVLFVLDDLDGKIIPDNFFAMNPLYTK